MVANVATSPRSRQQAAIDRAIGKAHEQATAGNLPHLLSSSFTGSAIIEVWAVGSRTTAGALYTVDLLHDHEGATTICDCAAADAQRVCWHRAIARLAHEDRVAFHRAPGVVRVRPRTQPPAPRPAPPRRALRMKGLTPDGLSGPRWRWQAYGHLEHLWRRATRC